jgi:hypothetical protein
MRRPRQTKHWLSQGEAHVIAQRYRLHFCIQRRPGAGPGVGYAFIAQSCGKNGLPISRDLSRVEVTENAFWTFLAFNLRLGVCYYEGFGEQFLHVCYLPEMAPPRSRAMRRGLRRRFPWVKKRRHRRTSRAQ